MFRSAMTLNDKEDLCRYFYFRLFIYLSVCLFKYLLVCLFAYFIYLCIYAFHFLFTLSYFSFQPVLHDWSNKGCGMCYPVCWMVHIKEPLLLIRKSSLCGGSGFPSSLSEWSLTVCLTPYNRR